MWHISFCTYNEELCVSTIIMREPFSCAPPTARAHFNVMQDSFTFGERKIRLSIIHTPVLMDIQSLFLKGLHLLLLVYILSFTLSLFRHHLCTKYFVGYEIHTGAKTNFLSRNSLEFDVWKMLFLWKIWSQKCKSCQKSHF